MQQPSIETLRYLTAQVARIAVDHREMFADADLVLPTKEYFPDAILASEDGLATLIARIVTYTPLAESVQVTAMPVEPETAAAKSCSSGACGPSAGEQALLMPALPTEDGYVLPLYVAMVGHPVRLTASLARSVGGAVAIEAGLITEKTSGNDAAVLAEATAHLSGLGVLLLAGANLFLKGCSGVKRMSSTTLSVHEQAFLLVAAAQICGYDTSIARKHVEPTQREALAWAEEFWADHAPTAEKLRTAPALLAGGAFEFERRGGFFARLFGGKREGAAPEAIVAKAKPVLSADEAARKARARALAEATLDADPAE
jgi:hypothetical protein